MINDEFEDLEDSDQLDLSDIDSSVYDVTKYSTQKLCDIIVCERYLGINKQLSISCMEELGKRRINGDDFDFETYIDNELKNLPILNFSLPDLGDVLRSFSGKMKK